MKNVSISVDKTPIDFNYAREQAVNKAQEMISEPTIVAWKDDQTNHFAPEIPGGKGKRWHDYGENFGGELELTVADKYHFIFVDSSKFDKPDLNLTSITKKDGGYFLCLNEACTDEDRKEFGAPYGGGLGDG